MYAVIESKNFENYFNLPNCVHDLDAIDFIYKYGFERGGDRGRAHIYVEGGRAFAANYTRAVEWEPEGYSDDGMRRTGGHSIERLEFSRGEEIPREEIPESVAAYLWPPTNLTLADDERPLEEWEAGVTLFMEPTPEEIAAASALGIGVAPTTAVYIRGNAKFKYGDPRLGVKYVDAWAISQRKYFFARSRYDQDKVKEFADAARRAGNSVTILPAWRVALRGKEFYRVETI